MPSNAGVKIGAIITALVFFWTAPALAEQKKSAQQAKPSSKPAQGGKQAEEASLWDQYKSNFIQDGRVIDYYQAQSSHSEGQGYGMLLAVTHNDRAAFDQMWNWTRSNLKVRPDNLYAWKWGKRPNNRWEVIDYNNATDGDMLIAYALLKASEKWNESKYKTEALKTVESVRKNLSVVWKDKTLLLPSYYGFAKELGFVLNPSYLVFPAFKQFAQADDKAFWEKVYKDSLELLNQATFGKLALPADWIMVSSDSRITIYDGESRNPYFSYEAIRTILHLSSDAKPQYPEGVEKMLAIYKKLGYLPLWVDLERDSMSLKVSPGGYYAVYGLAAKKKGEGELAKQLFKEGREKLTGEKSDYYSFSLYLLANSEAIL